MRRTPLNGFPRRGLRLLLAQEALLLGAAQRATSMMCHVASDIYGAGDTCSIGDSPAVAARGRRPLPPPSIPLRVNVFVVLFYAFRWRVDVHLACNTCKHRYRVCFLATPVASHFERWHRSVQAHQTGLLWIYALLHD